ncbi:hypothetical protein HMPREF9946_03131 [Acetobacteraceae bacterium AT-5844]|nr:hypothetical protein HMPREF9946_03131 [Acetobacteraceae bacterium AT-5844]
MADGRFKPGNPTAFKKGQSGNPGGRLKAVKEVEELARSHTELAINALVGVLKNKEAPPAAQVRAAEVILERGWGKPRQSVELSGPDGAGLPLSLEVRFVSPDGGG